MKTIYYIKIASLVFTVFLIGACSSDILEKVIHHSLLKTRFLKTMLKLMQQLLLLMQVFRQTIYT